MNWKAWMEELKAGDTVILRKPCGPNCKPCLEQLGKKGVVIALPINPKQEDIAVRMGNGKRFTLNKTLFEKALQ